MTKTCCSTARTRATCPTCTVTCVCAVGQLLTSRGNRNHDAPSIWRGLSLQSRSQILAAASVLEQAAWLSEPWQPLAPRTPFHAHPPHTPPHSPRHLRPQLYRILPLSNCTVRFAYTLNAITHCPPQRQNPHYPHYAPGPAAPYEPGMELEHFVTSIASCCPSRTTLLTGRYCHNTNVTSNACGSAA